MTLPDCISTAKPMRAGLEHTDEPHSFQPMRKVTGRRHLVAAVGYSLGGARRLFGETAFRHEIIAGILVFSTFAVVGAAPGEYVTMTVLLLGLAAAEALNTAIEEIIDRISPQWSSTSLHAKNLGSFAVFCLLAANGLMAMMVVISRLSSL